MESASTDNLVIGAGVIGSAVAWQLAKLGAGSVRVISGATVSLARPSDGFSRPPAGFKVSTP